MRMPELSRLAFFSTTRRFSCSGLSAEEYRSGTLLAESSPSYTAQEAGVAGARHIRFGADPLSSDR